MNVATVAKFHSNTPVIRQVKRHGVTFEELNAYSLACGYVQTVQNTDTRSLTLWMEHEHYHVRYCDRGRKGEDPGEFYRKWEVFDNLKDARKCFQEWLLIMVQYFAIEGNYGQGYETLTVEPSRSQANEAIKTYRENEPGVSFRIRPIKDVQQ